MKAKVRGIYSTALTKPLQNDIFENLQTSLTARKGFGLGRIHAGHLDLEVNIRKH